MKINRISPQAFSLLVILAIIALIFRQQGQVSAESGELEGVKACQANLRSLSTAFEMYATDSNGRYPSSIEDLVPRYIEAVPSCPVAGADSYTASLKTGPSAPRNLQDYQDFYYLACLGAHHSEAGLEADSPYATTIEGVQPDLSYLGSDQEKLAACTSNLKNLATALEMHAIDSGQSYPESLDLLVPNYLHELPSCPAARSDTYSSNYRTGPDAPGNKEKHRNYYHLECKGNNHGFTGTNPSYNSIQGLLP